MDCPRLAWWDDEMTVPHDRQALMDEVWSEIMDAAFCYFVGGVKTWLGDMRAPEFTDEQVERQFEQWDGYRYDHGAMHWEGNGSRPFAHDLTALPLAWKRAVCERVYVLCDQGGLWKDETYMANARKRRGEAHAADMGASTA